MSLLWIVFAALLLYQFGHIEARLTNKQKWNLLHQKEDESSNMKSSGRMKQHMKHRTREADSSDDCTVTCKGKAYVGKRNTTKSGRTCQRWDSQSPHQHYEFPDSDFPDATVSDAANFCRNPDDTDGLWCYTTDRDVKWEYCDVKRCTASVDCKTTCQGKIYVGTRSMTKSGRTCQRRDSQSPHEHYNFPDSDFPDATVSDAANLCRNPDDSDGLWCYTTDRDVKWEYCDVALCTAPVDCTITSKGRAYLGTRSWTKSGRTCQRWDSQSPHTHEDFGENQFPDATVSDAANFCRNPDDIDGLWCYTTDSDVKWEHCDVGLCSEFPQCKLDTVGSSYAGQETKTSTTKVCRRWSQMSQEQKQELPLNPAVPLEQNYCRNPNGRPKGPWCYIGDGVDDWEYCSIAICKTSASCTTTSKGETYVGTRSITKSGRLCQRWDSQYPHEHTTYDGSEFPDATVSDAANYCRNPAEYDGIWCFTTDSDVEWEYCDLGVCADCKETRDGCDYAGTKATDKDGRTCLPWSSTSYTSNEFFPDVSVSAAANYCRNPDRDGTGPWCMVSDGAGGQVKSDCGLPMCQDDTCTKNSSTRGSIKHILHVGIDGLHSTCWQNAHSGTPNLYSVAHNGSYTYSNARAELVTLSAPNWGSHLCGMSIQSTGITSNSWSPPWKGASVDITPVTGKTNPLPCAFYYLKGFDKSVKTGMFYDWGWLDNLGNGGMPGSVDIQYASNDAEVVDKASEHLGKILEAGDRSYTFVHMAQVDEAGHQHGWCSGKYLEAVDNVDALLGQLLEAVGNKNVLVVVSADHGGDHSTHGHMLDSNLLIPIFIQGPGVRKNYALTRLVRDKDILPTAAWVLGVKPSPYWDGQVMEEIFEEG